MLDVRNLRKTFGAFTAVDGVSFHVGAGETLAFLGPNGSGKSTSLRCIAGLMFPASGEILIEGASPAKSSTRKSFSYLPQRASFPDNLTAREVLEFYCKLRKLPFERADAVLDPGIPRDRLVRDFSGGMMQRLAIGVAMLPDVPLLILDEPTASLDPEGAIQFRSSLKTLKDRGKTIIFTSHVLSDVEQLADRVAILVGGRLAGIETAEALRRRSIRKLTLEEVYLRYVNEMHCGNAPFDGDGRMSESVAAAG